MNTLRRNNFFRLIFYGLITNLNTKVDFHTYLKIFGFLLPFNFVTLNLGAEPVGNYIIFKYKNLKAAPSPQFN